MLINEVIFMQLRIARLFTERYALEIHNVNKIFIDYGIYSLIADGYDAYHCGSDEIVYRDALEVLKREGAVV